MNIGLLLGGFGIGQGSIFVAQTWLMAKGEFDLLAAFGTHYSFAILGIILIDGGSTTVLARHVARRPDEPTVNDDIWQVFWETSVFRALVASLIGIAAAAYALGISSSGFSRSYVLMALPGCLVWAGNGVGLLDGLKLSGISGITGSMAYATSAIALALAPHASPEMAGSILGGAFSIGYLLTVGAQWAALGRNGWLPRFQKTTRVGLARSFKDGLVLLFQFLPGQIALRVQLVLSTIYLGTETTALYIYAKQIVSASTQIINFGSRVDFPELVQRTSQLKERNLGTVFQAQKTTCYCAIAVTMGTIIVCIIAPIAPQYNFSKAAAVLISLTPTILTISALLIMVQAVAALGDYASISIIVTATTSIGIVVSYLFVSAIDIYAFVIGEVISHVTGFCLLYLRMRLRT